MIRQPRVPDALPWSLQHLMTPVDSSPVNPKGGAALTDSSLRSAEQAEVLTFMAEAACEAAGTR